MNRTMINLLVLLLVLLVASSSIYVVKETERAVELRFGAITEIDVPPGLHFKVPGVDSVKKFDARVLTLDSMPESYFTKEKKRLIVDSFAKFRITDVATYYKATGGDESRAKSRLAARVTNGLRDQFGTRTLHDVVSGERDLLMTNLTKKLNADVLDELGVVLIDVRVKRIDLPPEVSEQVYRRMTAEREKEARELRSKGKEQAEKIRAAADRERTILEATAYSDSQRIRGEGDAQAASIYASAYTKDAEFYAFVRSLNAYTSAFRDRSDILLVDPKSDFFKYLNDSKAGR